MARNLEFYKGSRKKRNYALIPFVAVLALIVLGVVLFYTVQKYAVITKDGVKPIHLFFRNLTADERQILADGCLMNYYKNRK